MMFTKQILSAAIVLASLVCVSDIALAQEYGQAPAAAPASPGYPTYPNNGYNDPHYPNSNLLGFQYSFAFDNWGNTSGIVVTGNYFRALTAQGFCPRFLEPGDKLLRMNGIALVNEWAVKSAIDATMQYNHIYIEFINIRTGAYDQFQCYRSLSNPYYGTPAYPYGGAPAPAPAPAPAY
jgi:hypothetical protein